MRIGLIAPPWIPVPPPAYGGTEAVVANLALGLKERGHDVSLFTIATSTSPVRQLHLFAEAVEPIGQGMPEAAHVLAAYEALADMDLIHDHTMIGPLLAGRAGIGPTPVVTTNHGTFTTLSRRIYAEIARSASIVAISHDQASRSGGVPIAAVIHHGVDLDTYRPGPGAGGYLLFVGRMSPEKGAHHAVRIAREAGMPLRIISKMREASEYEYFSTTVKPLLGRSAPMPEELGLADRVTALRDAAGLVNPIAWDEPFGLVMAESLATGTPVVVPPRGSAPEIITDQVTGFLRSTDLRAVAAVAELGGISRTVCRAEAEDRFSAARMAADHEALYLRVLASPQDPTRRAARQIPAQPGTSDGHDRMRAAP